ncbi:MAG: putative methyltransferase [Parcubacteria bacterium C7867-006]|nr:MAG: putative methyltransferase [Parcubacteria bacterium C7867-006]
MHTKKCQLCGGSKLVKIIDLGLHPLADTFLPKECADKPITLYPLNVLLCKSCGHAMLGYVVPPEERYQKIDYSYTASNSKVSVEHFAKMAESVGTKISLGSKDLVIDIGSNDGTLLKSFKSQFGTKVIGIEPSKNIAKIAKKNGITTINDFFNTKTAKVISKKEKAKVIIATNVFNHITDMKAFVKDISLALDKTGLFIFEVPYFKTLVEQGAFDTIYLEHVSYFNVMPFHKFFKEHALYIHSLEKNDYMGGSIRVYVSKIKPKDSSIVNEYIDEEKKYGMYDLATYADFTKRIIDFSGRLNFDLYKAKASGEKIVAIGAATKGNTLLNYCKIDSTVIEFITDSSPLKIGKFAPGSNIPIRPDSDISNEISHALILPWNIADFLVSKLSHLNLKFIIPKMK